MELDQIRKRLDRKLTVRRDARVVARSNADAAESRKTEASHLSHAQQVLAELAEGVQRQVHDRISALVTRCLRSVLDEELDFRVLFDRRAGKTTARLAFFDNGEEIDPLLGTAGGALDLAAFALRLACLLVGRPPRRRLIVLDEPFKFVSDRGDYRERARDLVEALSTELGFQLVIITHDPTFEIGKVIDLG
jgi:DNA repair exonuclease SbcCD ATPase subunit